jgi:hypothetical protein
VNAGLVPALKNGELPAAGLAWTVISMRPGGDPLEALALELGRIHSTRAVLGSDGAGHAFIQEAKARLQSPHALAEILHQAAKQSNESILLIVDQFEEIFRYRSYPDPFGPIKFIALLVEALKSSGDDFYVVLTMRSDYLGDCARFSGLAEKINQSAFLTPRLTRQEQSRVIEEPLSEWGASIEPDLVAALLNESAKGDDEKLDPAEEGRDKLPLLQHALLGLWKLALKRSLEDPNQPIRLTLKDFEKLAEPMKRERLLLTPLSKNPLRFLYSIRVRRKEIRTGLAPIESEGNLQRILDNHCEKVYREVVGRNLRRRLALQRVFKSLTNRDRGKQDSRREVRPSEIASMLGTESSDLIKEIIDPFRLPGRNFISPEYDPEKPLDPDRPIDLVHESLIRRWRRLRTWADEERNAIDDYQRVVRDARRWHEFHALGDLMGTSMAYEYRHWPRDKTRWEAWAEAQASETETENPKWKRDFWSVLSYIRWSLRWQSIVTVLVITGLALGVAGYASFRQAKASTNSLLNENTKLQTALVDKSKVAVLLQTQISATTHDLKVLKENLATSEKKLKDSNSNLRVIQAKQKEADRAVRSAQQKLLTAQRLSRQAERRINALKEEQKKLLEDGKNKRLFINNLSSQLKYSSSLYKRTLLDVSEARQKLATASQDRLDAIRERNDAIQLASDATAERDNLRLTLANTLTELQKLQTPQGRESQQTVQNALNRLNTYESPQGTYTIKIQDGSASLWRLKESQPMLTLEGATGVAAFNPTEEWVAIATNDGKSRRVQAFQRQKDGSFGQPILINVDDAIAQIRITKKDHRILILSEDGAIRVDKLLHSRDTFRPVGSQRFKFAVFLDDDGDHVILIDESERRYDWEVGSKNPPKVLK